MCWESAGLHSVVCLVIIEHFQLMYKFANCASYWKVANVMAYYMQVHTLYYSLPCAFSHSSSATIQKRLKKEKKVKRKLQEALDFESKRREQVEQALKQATSPESLCMSLNGVPLFVGIFPYLFPQLFLSLLWENAACIPFDFFFLSEQEDPFVSEADFPYLTYTVLVIACSVIVLIRRWQWMLYCPL